MFDLRGKRVLVAGGSGLIGSAIVKAFKDEGAVVVNGDISGGDVYFNIADLTSMMGVLENQVSFSCFVNASYPIGLAEHTFAYCMSAELMAKKMPPPASIILISSIYGLTAPDYRIYSEEIQPPSLHYGIAKGGILQLTKFLAVKYAPRIRVNCVSPGGVQDGQPGYFIEAYCDKVPMRRMARPDDICGPVLFLASSASRYMTGQNIVVDGGLTCRI